MLPNRNDSQTSAQGNGKIIGKNSLHMKRRSEYPDSANQWHLPSQQAGLITSDPGKNSQNFNIPKHQAVWNNNNDSLTNGGGVIGVSHSQSSAGVTPTSQNSKRVQN